MMREIKFRAWTRWGMVYDYMPDYRIDPPAGTVWKDYADDEAATIMQYTGLKDKNGVEIYEGDIVRQWSSYQGTTTSPTAVVKAVRWHKTRPAFNIYSGTHLEVIGNIYENPELLGGK